MDKPTLDVVRAVTGTGKSTLAEMLAKFHNLRHFEADQYHIQPDGVYRFDPSRVQAAHADCLRKTTDALLRGESVVVANTFTQRWELAPYLALFTIADIRIHTLELFPFDAQRLEERNVHSVPREIIEKQYARFEYDIRKPVTA